MLTEREEMIVRWLRDKAVASECLAKDYGERGIYHVATDFHRQAAYDRERADAIERGEHLKRPSPSIPYETWVKTAGVG